MSKSGTQGGGTARDVMNYAPPQGPSNINDPQGPGLHGYNCGKVGSQGPVDESYHRESGSPGLGGMKHGMGTNRSG